MDLSEQTVFVTGATAGMGEAIARLFHRNGARIIAVGRREDRLHALVEELGERVFAIAMDVGDEDAVDRGLATIPAAFSNITILINNAGYALGLGRAQEADLGDWHSMIHTNIKGVVNCTHKILPGLVARNKGHVITVGSIAGSYPYPGGNVCGGTKAFTHQFSLNLKADLLGTRVRATSFEPGMTQTEFGTVRMKGDKKTADKNYQGLTPMTADNIADIVYYIATLPEHINVNLIEIMPTQQSFAGYAFDREDKK